MQRRLVFGGIGLLTLLGVSFFFFRSTPRKTQKHLTASTHGFLANRSIEKDEEETEEYSQDWLKQEWKMLRNPITGTIPANIREIEARVANKIPRKGSAEALRLAGLKGMRMENQNNYTSIGPNTIAGRSRTLAFDRRNPNILITGGTTGGIFRSTDGGLSWTFVSGENDIRSATAVAQSPLEPNTWYCGTGEAFYVTSTADIAGTFGYGIYKSTDNGVSWSKLPSTEAGSQHRFDNPFDLVHRMAVHPTTGDVYAAVHNQIKKSTDGGANWTTVLGEGGGNALSGLTELIIPSNGSKIFAAFSGENSNRDLAGVWESTSGNAGTWKRIAGGVAGQTDSVAGWQPYGQWSRIVLALNSANTKLFVLYKNGKSQSGNTPAPEADLFRADVSSGNPATYTWTNLSAFVPDEPNFNYPNIDPYNTYFSGFAMSINVKPDNDNILFIGGSVLHRVDLTKTTAAQKFRRIGGYGIGFFPDNTGRFIYPNHHPDVHGIYFPPGATDVMFTADDGGIHKTVSSTLADTVRWQILDSGLQTLQYQFINIHPDTDIDFVIGGAQDNGMTVNLDPSSADQIPLQSGDGASGAISQFFKNGNTWKQYWYTSVSGGSIQRLNLTWQVSGNNIDLPTSPTNTDITPTGMSGTNQWLTLFINDPDSSEQLYYLNQNNLYRTRAGSTVTSSTWTKMTGVSNAISSSALGSALAISKARNGVKYLYIGTDEGKVYRLNNANLAAATAVPVSITPTTMTPNSYVAGISVNPRNPDTVLVVVSSYDVGSNVVNNIFWTGNATSATPTWQVLDGELAPVSSQSCAIVVKTTGVEYYVGTSVGLYSTTAIAGNSTQWFNEGSGMLKKAIIRSLAIRQKDNTLVVGTHGNGAFITSIGQAVTLGDNIVTGVSDPVTNDKNFIRQVYPTLSNSEVQFTIGNMFTVKTITVQLFNLSGQRVYESRQNYQNGSVRLGALARGSYILQITSADGKYRHVQKILKE